MLGDKLNEDASQLMEGLLGSVNKMDSLLRAIADYSTALQLDPASVGPVPTDGVVRTALGALDTLVKDTGARVEYSDLPTVNGNWEQLSMLFGNLFQNAIQYRRDEAPRVVVSANHDGAAWRFEVEDNGQGIDSQYAERIFLPFERLQTGRDRSAGLGLAVCRRIVEAHGGTIGVDSKVGRGSTFFFTLPEADESNH